MNFDVNQKKLGDFRNQI